MKQLSSIVKQLSSIATRFETPVFTALRIVGGAMFAFHGAQKVLGWLSTNPQPPVGSQLWVGGLIELVAGALIMLGLFTRPAAFLASGEMAVAYVQFHWKLSLGDFSWLPAINKGELAVLYCLIFLFVTARGPGPISLDKRLGWE